MGEKIEQVLSTIIIHFDFDVKKFLCKLFPAKKVLHNLKARKQIRCTREIAQPCPQQNILGYP